MRTMTLLPLALALVQASAFAGPQTIPGPARPAIGAVPMVATYKPRPAEIDDVVGTYKLDNGATLKVKMERRRLYAELGQRGMTEMVPVGEYRYVSPDQRMTFEFNPLPFDGEVVLTYPADLNVAGSAPVTARTAWR
jgi:hypothetical protein